MFEFALGFSREKSKSRTSATSTENLSEEVARLTDADTEFVRNLSRMFVDQQGLADAFTKEAAIKDTEAQVAGLFQQYREESLPEILNLQARSGGYGSSTAARLANQAFAETVAKGSQIQTEAIKSYADIATMIRQVANQGLGITLDTLLQAKQKATKSGTTTGNSATSGTSTGAKAGVSFGGADVGLK